MAVIRELTVKLGLDTDFSTFSKAQKAIQSVVSTAMDLVAAFDPVSDAIDRAVEAGSDIQETANKFAVVFSDAAGGVQSQLDNIRKHTGATNLELQKMASNIGAIVKPSLGSAKAAGQVSTQMSLLALDIASFNNVSADRALIALRSGLIGSAEPLFAFGVDTRVAALEQEALRHGITQSIDEMTEGQRVMLRVAAIQRQLGTQGATGDATRTANDYANASRNLSKAIEETTGMVGGLLLKQRTLSVLDMRRTINRVQDWIKANRKLIMQRIDDFMERVHRIGRAVASVFVDLKDAVVGWFEALSPTTKRIMKIAAAVAVFAVAMTLPFAPILLLIGLVALLIEDFDTWRKGGDSLIGDFIAAFPQLIATVQGVWRVFKELFFSLVAWFKGQGRSADEWAAAIILAVSKAAAIWTILRAPLLIVKGIILAIGLSFIAIAAGVAYAIYAVVKFIAVMVTGFAQLIEQAGGFGPALLQVLNDAFNWWLEFFGSSREELNKFLSDSIESFKRWSVELGQSLMAGFSGVLGEAAEFWADFFFSADAAISEFVRIAGATLKDFWKNIIDYWLEKAKGVFAKIGSFIPGFGGDDDEDQQDAAAARGAAAVSGAVERQRAAGGLRGPATSPVVPGPLAAGQVSAPGVGAGPTALTQNTTQNISLTVTPGPGMDERRLADMVVERIQEERDVELRSTLESYALEAP